MRKFWQIGKHSDIYPPMVLVWVVHGPDSGCTHEGGTNNDIHPIHAHQEHGTPSGAIRDD